MTRTYVEFAAIFSDPNYIKYYTFLTRYWPSNFLTFKGQEIITVRLPTSIFYIERDPRSRMEIGERET